MVNILLVVTLNYNATIKYLNILIFLIKFNMRLSDFLLKVNIQSKFKLSIGYKSPWIGGFPNVAWWLF